jgi:hypothetical protein
MNRIVLNAPARRIGVMGEPFNLCFGLDDHEMMPLLSARKGDLYLEISGDVTTKQLKAFCDLADAVEKFPVIEDKAGE